MNGFHVLMPDCLKPSVALERWRKCAAKGEHIGTTFSREMRITEGDSEGIIGERVLTVYYCSFCEHTVNVEG